MNQSFQIDIDVMKALRDDDVEATAKDMRELGLYHLPYPCIDLIVPTDSIIVRANTGEKFPPLGPNDTIRVTLDEACTEVLVSFQHKGRAILGAGAKDNNVPYWKNFICRAQPWRDLIIVVLATKNTEKEVVTPRVSKLAKLGIGKRRAAGGTSTIIRLAKVLPTEDGHTGTKKRPHLRRGHKRNQHYKSGPRPIWIAPMFVNADEAFVEARSAYKVRI